MLCFFQIQAKLDSAEAVCTAAGSPRCSPDRAVRAQRGKQASVQGEIDGFISFLG